MELIKQDDEYDNNTIKGKKMLIIIQWYNN